MMVSNGTSNNKMDDNWGYPHDSGNHHFLAMAKRHDGLPVRIRHVSHQHLTLLELAHLIDAGQDVHLEKGTQ